MRCQSGRAAEWLGEWLKSISAVTVCWVMSPAYYTAQSSLSLQASARYYSVPAESPTHDRTATANDHTARRAGCRGCKCARRQWGKAGASVLSLPLLLGVVGAALFVWFWQNSLSARERANRAALEACQRMHLQFLDGTVAFARLGVARGDQGRLTLRRTYVFDYTATSIERRQGFVVLLGTRIESLGFEPDAQHPGLRQSEHPSHSQTDLDHTQSNVLDLAEWRKRHRNQTKLPDGRSRPPKDNTPNDSGW